MEKSPLFVKVEEYKEILDVVDKIKERINSAHQTVAEIKDIRDREAQAISDWEDLLSQFENKVFDVDSLLFEPEN